MGYNVISQSRAKNTPAGLRFSSPKNIFTSNQSSGTELDWEFNTLTFFCEPDLSSGVLLLSSALDTVTGRKVAIKKMQQPFVMPMSAKRAYREFVLLSSIRHPNVRFKS